MYYVKSLIWAILVNTIGKSLFIPGKIRFYLYKIAGMKTDTSNIRPGCLFRYKNVILEKGVFLNYNVFLDCTEKIHIKENTWIAFNVKFYTSTHLIGNEKQRAGKPIYAPITVGKGCWIGANATILPGVTIGDGCIIAAGAVVNKDCQPNGVYAGVPAKRIKDLD